ncbi:MAG: hypothetical protein PHF46_02415 [Candidatus Gracilibacteria bacterium]|nr:hypothetical protein [Candidatus Gracilibacteria bacterium]MDD4530142.1 hypothetical protein [Candidatus Gracilibacteria bacterium]
MTTTQDTALVEANNKVVPLNVTETAEIQKAFQEARDFRTIGEKITAPIDNIITETASIIDKDPIMNVSDELTKMNQNVQVVYKEIIDNDGVLMKMMKQLPLIGNLAKSLDTKWDEASFNIKSLEGKIGVIFSGFDQSYNSLSTSIDLQKKFIDGIEENLGKVISYKEFLAMKLEEFQAKLNETTDENEKMKLEMFLRNVQFFQTNLTVLIGNLQMAHKRLLMRLDSANKLTLAMSSSRPIFKTLLSTALIETSSQKALDASMKAMDVMGETIDKMSSGLTDKAIESSRRSEELSSKPVLSTAVFIENVTKLKTHFDEIETYRAQIEQEAKQEREIFNEAKTKLEGIKTLNKASQEEFAKELQQADEQVAS